MPESSRARGVGGTGSSRPPDDLVPRFRARYRRTGGTHGLAAGEGTQVSRDAPPHLPHCPPPHKRDPGI